MAIAGLCAAGVAAEVLLRIYPAALPEEAAIRLYWQALHDAGGLKSVHHDDVAYLMPASVEDEISAGGIAFTYSTDQHGFRNQSWPDRADIVVLGDSLAFGFGVEDDEGWVELLAQSLTGHEIVNLGILAAAPQQWLMAYEAFGAPLEPELVTVALYPPNALGAVGVFDEWVEAGRPERLDVWRAERNRRGTFARVKDALMRSYLVTGLYFGAKELVAPLQGRTFAFEDGGRIQLAPAEVGMAPLARPGQPEFERIVEVLLRLQELVVADGAEFLVLLFPSKWEALEPLLGGAPPDLVAPFATRLDEIGVAHLDLTPHLRERVARGERLFFEVDIHPNRAGYQVIAEALADHLNGRVVD